MSEYLKSELISRKEFVEKLKMIQEQWAASSLLPAFCRDLIHAFKQEKWDPTEDDDDMGPYGG